MRVALMLCLAAAMPVFAQPLGRLFFTPEQRLVLDRQREQGDPAAAAATIRFDGSVTGSRGRPVVWINGRMESAVSLRESLRVGESVDAATRTRTDVVPDGSIRRSAQ